MRISLIRILTFGLTFFFLFISGIKSNSQIKKIITDSTKENKECLITHDSLTFMNSFFPFKFENYNTKKYKSYFEKSVIVDSVETNNDGYITRVYCFKNKLSQLSFFVKINDPEPYFYLYCGTIKNNLFKSKNGVKINMKREDFFKTINEKVVKCDTFKIQEGEMATYYYFIFKKDKLNTIEIQQSQ